MHGSTRGCACKFYYHCGASQDLWKNRDPPKPLDLDSILAEMSSVSAETNGSLLNGAAHSNGTSQVLGDSACKALGLKDAHRVWTLKESTQVCCCST